MSTVRRRTKSGSREDLQIDNFETGYGYPVTNPQTFVDTTTTSSTSSAAAGVDPLDMSCRDRTGEFRSAVKSLQSSSSGKANASYPVSRYAAENGRSAKPSQFTLLSRQIGKDISNTFNKLEKLAILAKRKSLFNDKPVEIQELTYIIKQDIKNLNQQLGGLQQLVNHRDGNKSKNVQTHSHTVVMSLQSKLKNISQDFKRVLEVRTENMKAQKNRREQFSQGALAETIPSTDVSSNSLLHRHSGAAGPSSSSSGDGGGSCSLDMDSLMLQSSSQDQMLVQNDEYVKSRANAMESIESTIVELGGIFNQLAHLVKEQEEQIGRIDSNVEDTELNVEAAHSELLKYFQNISSNRWLIIKIFFVLILFFIIFVVFMV